MLTLFCGTHISATTALILYNSSLIEASHCVGVYSRMRIGIFFASYLHPIFATKMMLNWINKENSNPWLDFVCVLGYVYTQTIPIPMVHVLEFCWPGVCNNGMALPLGEPPHDAYVIVIYDA